MNKAGAMHIGAAGCVGRLAVVSCTRTATVQQSSDPTTDSVRHCAQLCGALPSAGRRLNKEAQPQPSLFDPPPRRHGATKEETGTKLTFIGGVRRSSTFL